MEVEELEEAGPDNGKVGETDDFVDHHKGLAVVLLVVVHEEVVVLCLFVGVLRVVDQQDDVHENPQGQHQEEETDGVINGPGKSNVLEVLLEGQRSVLIVTVGNQPLLYLNASLDGQPLYELHYTKAVEGNSQGRGVPGQLNEDVDKDKLAEQKEVVEGCAHAEEEGGHADEEGQDGASSEQVVEVTNAAPVFDVIVRVDVDVPDHFLSNGLLADKQVLPRVVLSLVVGARLFSCLYLKTSLISVVLTKRQQIV